MNIQQIIDQAREIEATTDAKFAGAVMQVTKRLSPDECIAIFTDAGMTPRMEKQVSRFRNGSKDVSEWTLRDLAYGIVLNAAR